MSYALLGIDDIYAGTPDTRARADDPSLALLAASIARHGLLQPIVVRKNTQMGRYVLVCGARRLQACRMAGLRQVDAVVLDIGDAEAAACRLEEHLTHRAPHFLDEAQAIRHTGPERVLSSFALPAALVQNRLQMLALPECVQANVRRDGLSLEQARPLLAIRDEHRQLEAAAIIAQRGLSGTQARRLVYGPEPQQASPSGRRRAVSAALGEVGDTARRLKERGIPAQVTMHSQEGGLCIQILIKNGGSDAPSGRNVPN